MECRKKATKKGKSIPKKKSSHTLLSSPHPLIFSAAVSATKRKRNVISFPFPGFAGLFFLCSPQTTEKCTSF
jgi:hypothetical protein